MTNLAYTDYPVAGEAGVKEVEVLAYDRNKYATVRYGDCIEGVKAGYLYRDIELQRPYGARKLYALPSAAGEQKPTRREAHAELMAQKRHRHTEYTLWIGDEKRLYRNLRNALQHFGRVFRECDCVLMRARESGRTWSQDYFIESEQGSLVIPVWGRKQTCLFRARHRRIGKF